MKWFTLIVCVCSAAAGPTTIPTSKPSLPPPAQATKVTSVTVDPAAVPRTPGYSVIRPTLVIDDQPMPFSCGLVIPKTFGKWDQKPPLVIGLHNRYAIGSKDLSVLTAEGFGWSVRHAATDNRFDGAMPKEKIDLSADPPFITLLPMLPAGQAWETPAMLAVMRSLIPQIVAATGADPDRVYLTGFSYGASSTWLVAAAMPELFAAVAVCDGRATANPSVTVDKLKNVGVYLSVGGGDRDFLPEARRMRDALSGLPHPYFVSRVVPRGNHFCYEAVYRDPAFWHWLFEQRRFVPPVPKPKAVKAAK